MSLKKTLRSTSNHKQPTVPLKSTGTQTEQESLEVLNYRKTIDILVKEVELLKKQVADFKSRDKLVENRNSVKDQSDEDDAVKTGSLIPTKTEDKNVKCVDAELNAKLARGCSCKGNCANKICGCVKKGLFCSESCRCKIKQCKNQEASKENVDQETLSLVSERTLERLSSLTLNQESIHESGRKLKRGVSNKLETVSKTPNHKKTSVRSNGSGVQRQLLFSQDSDEEHDRAQSLQSHQTPAPAILAKHIPEKMKINGSSPQNKGKPSLSDSCKINSNLEIHDEHIVKRKYTTRKLKQNPGSDSALSDDVNGQGECNVSSSITTKNLLSTEKHSTLLDPSSIRNNYSIKIDPPTKKNKVVAEEFHHKENRAHSSFESNSSGSNSGAQDNLDVSFNPMVPKRQLPRSPINSEGITVVIPTQNKRFSPPKKGGCCRS
ncbi:hypothetical protein QAD02_012498 [Eretmocerus hayati]|uniref:Uncharacterized protein n=1 Tax=Eretmocerus hayati TaxID=131215 RepID=A0ACC2P0W7_9HYME|nr:hypothetical protein QAD02_012498 [Eretmocerus hayati]